MKPDMIREIINIMKEYHSKRDKSFLSLLKKTGYLDGEMQITERDIYEELVNMPDCIEYWLRWSEDKRVDKGWIFLETTNGRYVVSYFPQTLENFQEKIFTDKFNACAYFIMREIESVKRNDIKRRK